MTVQTPTLSSMAGETAWLLGMSRKPRAKVTGSPQVTRPSASLRSFTPISTQTSVNCGTLFRSSVVSRCGARRETTAARGLCRVHTVSF